MVIRGSVSECRLSTSREKMCSKCRCLAVFVYLLITVVSSSSVTHADSASLRKSFGGLGSLTGISVMNADTGAVVFEHNGSSPLKPASTLKLLTSATALDVLGPRHSFETEVWFSGEQGKSVDKVYVRGGGDPSLTIESAWTIARKLKRIGITRVGSLAVDTSLIIDPESRQGQRAYEAGSSAMAFNFNNLTFEICPGRPGTAARVVVDPWEYPMSLVGTIQTASGNKGTYRVDEKEGEGVVPTFVLGGTIGSKASCANVYRSVGSPGAYFAQTFIGLLKGLGIEVQGGFVFEKVSSRARKVFVHYSKDLGEIVRDLNHYSNNMIAEQLLYSLSAKTQGPWSRSAGIQAMDDFALALGVQTSESSISDGSGLSHDNRVSARVLSRVLTRMQDPRSFIPEFEGSLPVPGARLGTLKYRDFGIPSSSLRAKTGSIRGVSSLAGYVVNKRGGKYAFSIIQNGVKNRWKAREVEAKLVKAIYSQ